MRACVGLGGEKRRQERGEVVTEEICKHRTLLTTYTHSTHNLGGAWPPTRSSSLVICGSIDEVREDVYSHSTERERERETEKEREPICDCHPPVFTTVFTLCIWTLITSLLLLPGNKHDTEAEHQTEALQPVMFHLVLPQHV